MRKPSALLLTAVVLACAGGTPTPAEASETRASGRCPIDFGQGRVPSLSTAAPPAPLLASLSVLRRPRAPGDRSFSARDLYAGTVFVEYSRRLGVGPRGERYFLVPVISRALRYSPSCKRRQPARRRRALERTEREWRQLAREPAIALVEVGREGGSGSEVGLEDIRENHAVSAGCSGERQCQSASTTFDGLVPDGVAAVRLRFAGAPEQTRPVANNFWVTDVPVRFDDAELLSTDWLDSEGAIIRTFDDSF